MIPTMEVGFIAGSFDIKLYTRKSNWNAWKIFYLISFPLQYYKCNFILCKFLSKAPNTHSDEKRRFIAISFYIQNSWPALASYRWSSANLKNPFLSLLSVCQNFLGLFLSSQLAVITDLLTQTLTDLCNSVRRFF